MALKVRESGSWRDVRAAYTRVSGEWRSLKSVDVKVAGAIKNVPFWPDTTKIENTGVETERFGYAIAAYGDIILVGDYLENEDGSAEPEGAAYIYERVNGSWSLSQTLRPPNYNGGEEFGHSVAIDGDTILVGAPGEDSTFSDFSGAAYVFVKENGSWVEQEKLTAETQEDYARFGDKVDLSGDYAIIGEQNGDKAYIFQRTGTSWAQQQKLADSSESVAIDGNTALVGNNDDSPGFVDVFVLSNGNWSLQERLTPENGTQYAADFGVSVSISGDYALIGDSLDDQFGFSSGAAHLFKRSGNIWSFIKKIPPPEGTYIQYFGSDLKIDKNIMAISSSYSQGRVYVYVIDDTGPVLQTTFEPEGVESTDENYGEVLGFGGGTLVAKMWRIETVFVY